MKELFCKLKDTLENGQDAMLVTIIASSGSTPRGSGARMLMTAAGRICGTIGGGAVEYQAEQKAMALLNQKQSLVKDYILSPNDVADLGMVCGGDVQVYFQYIDPLVPAYLETCRNIDGLFEKSEPSWLVTKISDGIHNLGIYTASGGFTGLDLDNANEEALALIKNKAVRGKAQGMEYYAEPLVRAGFVFVFGGGHVAQELVPLLSHIGFRCVVFEDRPRFASKELFPGAAKVILGDFLHIDEKITISADDYVVIMTRGHANDYEVQKQALKTEACYIGVIGSRNKIKVVSEKLMKDGFTPADLKRVHTPIGLDIKAETPAEIAVSVAGELILTRAGRMA